MTKKFTSLEELKNFVIAEKIANYEKQKQIENKLFASLAKDELQECARCGVDVNPNAHPEIGCDY